MIGEPVLTMAEAAKLVPSRPHIATVWRWATRGCRGVKLETVMIGGQRFTTETAIEKFFTETTQATNRGQMIQDSTKDGLVDRACEREGI